MGAQGKHKRRRIGKQGIENRGTGWAVTAGSSGVPLRTLFMHGNRNPDRQKVRTDVRRRIDLNPRRAWGREWGWACRTGASPSAETAAAPSGPKLFPHSSRVRLRSFGAFFRPVTAAAPSEGGIGFGCCLTLGAELHGVGCGTQRESKPLWDLDLCLR